MIDQPVGLDLVPMGCKYDLRPLQCQDAGRLNESAISTNNNAKPNTVFLKDGEISPGAEELVADEYFAVAPEELAAFGYQDSIVKFASGCLDESYDANGMEQ